MSNPLQNSIDVRLEISPRDVIFITNLLRKHIRCLRESINRSSNEDTLSSLYEDLARVSRLIHYLVDCKHDWIDSNPNSPLH